MRIATALAATAVATIGIAGPVAASPGYPDATGRHGSAIVEVCQTPVGDGPYDYVVAAADARVAVAGSDSWQFVTTDGRTRRAQAVGGVVAVTLQGPPVQVNGIRLTKSTPDGTVVQLLVTAQPECEGSTPSPEPTPSPELTPTPSSESTPTPSPTLSPSSESTPSPSPTLSPSSESTPSPSPISTSAPTSSPAPTIDAGQVASGAVSAGSVDVEVSAGPASPRVDSAAPARLASADAAPARLAHTGLSLPMLAALALGLLVLGFGVRRLAGRR